MAYNTFISLEKYIGKKVGHMSNILKIPEWNNNIVSVDFVLAYRRSHVSASGVRPQSRASPPVAETSSSRGSSGADYQVPSNQPPVSPYALSFHHRRNDF